MTLRRALTLMLVLALAACGGAPSRQAAAPRYKVGAPYEVKGVTYTPHEDYSYDETGIASWYGEAFNHGLTANGEVFNKNELTAAHKTLPLPTLARVTNLDNGRSIVVRINDRGPFSGARIIDVSQRAAQLLGFEQSGTAKVRVQVLADESKAIADAMRHYGTPTAAPVMVAANQPVPPQEMPPPEAQQGGLATAAVETKTLEPIRTTPAVHQQLLKTEPVPEVEIVPLTGHNQIFVQAGSFTVLENATKLKERLGHLGTVTVSDVMINGRMFHRVRLAAPTVPAADKLLSEVRKAGIANARTVVD